ncbi:MAG: hypothetical protein DRQ78_07725, partial [Epsilonproteobacteria bacterium]
MKKFYTLLLTLAVSTVWAQAAVKTTKHKIKNGETLYTIAHKNHTTIEEVRKINKLKKGDILKLGRVLIVPKDTYFPEQKNKKLTKKIKIKKTPKLAKYSIKKGDTLFIIARKHHTTIEEVRKINKLKKGDILKLGRVLKVPRNTYNAPKQTIKIASKKSKKKLAKSTKTVKKQPKVSKTTKISKNKNLLASISELETINLEKNTKKKSKKNDIFALSDFLFDWGNDTPKESVKITSLAKEKLGKKYVWGAAGGKNTFDCSGFTKYVYKKNGIDIPRTSIRQSKYGQYVKRADLKKGDLVFFDTSKRRKGYVNHVGIYIGNNKFIHASSSKKKV